MHNELATQSRIVIIAFALAFGVTAGLVGWLFSASVADAPSENRQYKDAPPFGFRMVWLLVLWLDQVVAQFVSRQRRDALEVTLRRAGLEFALSPTQFIAGRMLCAAAAAGMALWLLGSFTHESPSIGQRY